MNSYLTLEKAAKTEYVVKHSRFITTVAPVTTNEEAVQFVADVRSEYGDATHNVYAYVLREGQMKRYSDDGEPQGTAGMPVLDVLLKEGVTDCALVVTRYFGGILLGGGGLVRAYSHSAKLGVDAAGIVRMSLCAIMELKCDYSFYGRVPALLADFEAQTQDTQFTDEVTVVFRMPVENVAPFEKELTERSFGKFNAKKLSETFAAIKI
ncbi:MAG: YigZ family protein [Clostridia bacterium]|nr:YigZ family protein [Clostridia bacterium]MBR6779958.1 YigZ family protein [Clostridia bacterium]